jgi:chromosome segregation ATPase
MEAVANRIKEHVEKPYRALVKSFADAKKFDIENTVHVLTQAGRTPEQLDADVACLLARRSDAKLLADVEKLTADIEAASERYREATKQIESLQEHLSKAAHDKRQADNLETRRAFNDASKRFHDAKDEGDFAFKSLSSLRDRRDKLRTEVLERLTKTAIPGTDIAQPENFKLCE